MDGQELKLKDKNIYLPFKFKRLKTAHSVSALSIAVKTRRQPRANKLIQRLQSNRKN